MGYYSQFTDLIAYQKDEDLKNRIKGINVTGISNDTREDYQVHTCSLAPYINKGGIAGQLTNGERISGDTERANIDL